MNFFQTHFLLGTEVFSTFFYTLFWTFSKVFSFRYRSLFQNCFLLGTEVFFKSIFSLTVFYTLFWTLFLLGTEGFSNVFSFRYRSIFQKSCVFFIYNFFLLGTEVVFPNAFSCRYRSLLGRNVFLLGTEFFLLGTDVFSWRYRHVFFYFRQFLKMSSFLCSKAIFLSVQKH